MRNNNGNNYCKLNSTIWCISPKKPSGDRFAVQVHKKSKRYPFDDGVVNDHAVDVTFDAQTTTRR